MVSFHSSPLPEWLSPSLSLTINGTLSLQRSLQMYTFVPRHICRCITHLHFLSQIEPETLRPLVWDSCPKNTVYLVSMRGLWMPCLPLQYLDQWIFFSSNVGVHTGLIAACGENAQPSLLVNLFINGLRVLCVLKGQCCTMQIVTLT